MKKISGFVPFLLIFVVCIVSIRFLFFISYIQFQKSNLRAQLLTDKSAEILRLTFAENDVYEDQKGFEWKENNKELVINGKYFEVLKTEKVNGKIIVSVLADKAEDELINAFFDSKKNSDTDFVNLLKDFLNLTYLKDHTSSKLLNLFFPVMDFFVFKSSSLQHFYCELIKPPINISLLLC